jgi:hypothetical protein
MPDAGSPSVARRGARTALLAIALAWAAVSACGSDWTPAELMRLLALGQARSAHFEERRFLSVVDAPLESSGELSFVPPAHLEKHTLRPKDERLTLDGDDLVLQRAGRRPLHMNLSERPEAAAFVESIRGTLAGDLATLERLYSLELTGSAERWRLALVPRDAGMAQILARVRFSGVQGAVERIEFEFANGDRSEMTVTPVAAQ